MKKSIFSFISILTICLVGSLFSSEPARTVIADLSTPTATSLAAYEKFTYIKRYFTTLYKQHVEDLELDAMRKQLETAKEFYFVFRCNPQDQINIPQLSKTFFINNATKRVNFDNNWVIPFEKTNVMAQYYKILSINNKIYLLLVSYNPNNPYQEFVSYLFLLNSNDSRVHQVEFDSVFTQEEMKDIVQLRRMIMAKEIELQGFSPNQKK